MRFVRLKNNKLFCSSNKYNNIFGFGRHENKSNTHIPKCNDHLECEKYENGIKLRMYFMCMFEIKCVMYKRWQILPFHAKDIVEKIKRNIKKLFKSCVYENIVCVHIYH